MGTTYIRIEGLKAVQESLSDFPRRVKEVARGWARQVAYDERDMIRRNIHSRSGRTVQYGVQIFESTQGQKAYFTIRLGKVVQWLESGTGLYGPRAALIYPTRGKVLRFVIGGRVLFRPFVRGMQAQRVISAGRNEMASQLPGRLTDLANRIEKAWKE